ncbi:Ger(x)C family spore germination protein [Bacillus cereus]|uniref:Ger(x)C family spore germination protein n=1 Tax=Bacillus cereus TaxID=1396 RepID=UPI002111F5DC|nr:Ger(x)C family spore germination protein [Bacillus cereus]
MKRFYIFICFIFLVGCWDQKPLRKTHLAYSVGYDLAKNRDLKQTVEIVHVGSKLTNEIHSSVKHTAQDTTEKLRTDVTGDISYIKYGLQLFGKELEKNGIFPTLDVAFRDPENPTALVKLVSTEGLASDILEKRKIGNVMIGEFLKNKINTLEERSYFPEENLESIFKKILDKGEDFTIPSIKIQGKEVVTNGLALFHHDKLTGRMPLEHCVLFTLLKDSGGKKAHITTKISDCGYVSVEFKTRKVKRKMKVTADKFDHVHVDIKLKLFATIIEYPYNHLNPLKGRKELSRQLSEKLTEESQNIIRMLKKANCDAFGIGRQIMAYHPEYWGKFNYKNVKFHTKVDIRVIGSGTLK